MNSSETMEQKRAEQAASRVTGKGGFGAGGALPPAAPRRSRGGSWAWLKVAIPLLVLLVIGGAVYGLVSEEETQSTGHGGATGEPASVAALAGAASSPVGDIIPLRRAAPSHGLVYEEVVTGGADAEAPLPLIIAVHGLGDRPDRFKKLFLSMPFAARVIVPRGPADYHDGYSWFTTEIKDGKVVRLVYGELRASARRLALLADAMAERWPTVGSPVITGFSQGGILAFLVAADHSGSIAGAIPMSGIWPRELRPSGPLPTASGRPAVVALHGEEDALVPYAEAQESVLAMRALGMEVRLEGFQDVAHRVSAEMRLRLFELLAELLAKPELSYLTSAM